jgi:glycosyltransferase involved in cell wall biosynthesis
VKILTFSTLYPDSSRPGHGIFVETRLRYLIASGQIESRVVAPVPWFPFKHPRFGEYAAYAGVPKRETWHDIDVYHPRYPLIPKFGMTPAPLMIAMAVKNQFEKIIREGFDFDIIDAHYFYPDGVAAAILAKWLGKPVVITARGTDLNLIPQFRLPRKMIQWAARESSAMITVCQALKDVLVQLGVEDSKVTVLRNGVNLELFSPPASRESLRRDLGIEGKTILSVGYLIARKGHDLVIAALEQLPDVKLLIAGDGPEKSNLVTLADSLGVRERVAFLGSLNQDSLRNYYRAVDMLVLASSREGWANVLLESMACGTPVVATNIWGTPEVVRSPEAGILVERRPPDIASAIRLLYENYPDRHATRRYAEQFSWDDTTQGQLDIFSEIVNNKFAN